MALSITFTITSDLVTVQEKELATGIISLAIGTALVMGNLSTGMTQVFNDVYYIHLITNLECLM